MKWLDFGSMLRRNKQLLGLDIGSSAIKVVQMKEVNGKYFLQKFGMKPLEPEVIVEHALPGHDHTSEFDYGLDLILDALEARRT